MLQRFFDWTMGPLIDWLFKDKFQCHCEFERNHGWLPKVGNGINTNDSGIHGEWGVDIITAEDVAITLGNGAFAD